MKRKLLLLCLPVLIYAQNLAEILDEAAKKSLELRSSSFLIAAQKQNVQALKVGFYPRFDVGANLTSLNEKASTDVGDTYETYAKVGFDVYDGAKRKNQVNALKTRVLASEYEQEAFKRRLFLELTEDFFRIKNTEVSLNALVEKSAYLKAELERVKSFYEVGSVTKDDIDKLKAEYSTNLYEMDSLKHQLLSLKRLLVLKVGQEVKGFEDSVLKRPENVQKQEQEEIKALNKHALALGYETKVLESAYLPKLELENTYSIYEYDREASAYSQDVDKQNKLILSLSLRLYDGGVSKKKKEALELEKKALLARSYQAKRSQDINVELALSNIKSIDAQIKSAKASVVAAQSAFVTIWKKFEVGRVDNVAYLDALSVKTSTKAQYESALNNLQIAYARYYYAVNQNIRNYIK